VDPGRPGPAARFGECPPLPSSAPGTSNLRARNDARRNAPRLTRTPPLQKSMRDFLKKRTSYDVLPLSFRLIILNTDLLVKKSLNILLQNGPRTPR
jgi:hypothetical protein